MGDRLSIGYEMALNEMSKELYIADIPNYTIIGNDWGIGRC